MLTASSAPQPTPNLTQPPTSTQPVAATSGSSQPGPALAVLALVALASLAAAYVALRRRALAR